jgi:hypothetical protein
MIFLLLSAMSGHKPENSSQSGAQAVLFNLKLLSLPLLLDDRLFRHALF